MFKKIKSLEVSKNRELINHVRHNLIDCQEYLSSLYKYSVDLETIIQISEGNYKAKLKEKDDLITKLLAEIKELKNKSNNIK